MLHFFTLHASSYYDDATIKESDTKSKAPVALKYFA